jgi:acetyl esterase/lipase
MPDPTDVLSRAAEPPDAVVRYADHEDGLLDVFLPASVGTPDHPCPLVVFVHGGFWRQVWNRKHARPLANALVAHGMVVAVPEYRRTGGAGGWPATGDDVEAAVSAARRLIDEVAPAWTDPTAPLTLSGHSAGGHLALWSGLRLGPATVHSVVALAPVADLPFAARERLDGDATALLLGGDPDEAPDAYDAADPFAGLAAHSTDQSAHPPITVIHGTADAQVPVTMSRAIAQRHPRVDYIELEGVDHFALIDPLSTAFAEAVLPALQGRPRDMPATADQR